MSLARERQTMQESQPLVQQELVLDLTESYQSSRKIPYKRNRAVAAVEAVFESLFLSLLLAEEGLAIDEIVKVNPNTVLNVIQGTDLNGLSSFVGDMGWLIMVTITAGWTTGIWIYGMVAASCNAQAVVQMKPELPYAPLSRRLMWLTVQMLMWWIVLAGFVTCWIIGGNWSVALSSGAFVARMFLVILFGIFTSFPLIMNLSRKAFDACLASCKSPCYDL